MPADPIEIVEVVTPQQRTEFIHFQWVPYQGNPYWVPPLISERQVFLDKTQHPFHQHSEVALFMAQRGGQTVGTIAAILNNRHNQVHNENLGFFGLFECIEDYAVAERLLATARDWVKARGKTAIRGPANFSVNEEVGLLVDPFDKPPCALMTYNPPYYKDFIERFGFVKAMDMHALFIDVGLLKDAEKAMDPRLVRLTKKLQQRNRITIRRVDLKNFDREVEIIKSLYEQAWEKNWGAIPMTDAEIDYLGHNLRQFVDPDLVLIAETGGEPVGLALCLPDLNIPLRKAYPNPRTPEWWTLLKLVYHWKVRKEIDTLRVVLLGVLEKYRLQGIEAMLYFEVAKYALPKGIHKAECGWVLETNDLMRRGIEGVGGRVYKTYRMYDLQL
ncbi:MAG TPA: N-acetyltransferase [Anaerolineae bacterium]|nr:N-acetyltransferase [Anaerolineae bacterium]